MAWDVGLVGWRSAYGGTAFGWPENVAAEGRHWIAKQNQQGGNKTECRADPAQMLTTQASDSRLNGMNGKGRAV